LGKKKTLKSTSKRRIKKRAKKAKRKRTSNYLGQEPLPKKGEKKRGRNLKRKTWQVRLGGGKKSRTTRLLKFSTHGKTQW